MGRWLDLPAGDGRMRCFLAEPAATDGRGVLVCMHGPGIDAFIQDICERLASRGYAAIAPDFYHRQPEPLVDAWKKIDDNEALQDMAVAVAALQRVAGTDPGRQGVIGFCMGGRLAFLYSANHAELRAAVVFHGGNIMIAREGLRPPLAQAGGMGAPLLGLFGAEDENPSAADVGQIDAELTRLGKAHEFHSYAGAGHAFLNFTRPAVYREAQAADAWGRCVDWLDRYLMQPTE